MAEVKMKSMVNYNQLLLEAEDKSTAASPSLSLFSFVCWFEKLCVYMIGFAVGLACPFELFGHIIVFL